MVVLLLAATFLTVFLGLAATFLALLLAATLTGVVEADPATAVEVTAVLFTAVFLGLLAPVAFLAILLVPVALVVLLTPVAFLVTRALAINELIFRGILK